MEIPGAWEELGETYPNWVDSAGGFPGMHLGGRGIV